MFAKLYYHLISTFTYRLKYFMKPIISQLRNIHPFFPRQLRAYSLFLSIVWLFLIGGFLCTTWQLCSILLKQPTCGNNVNPNYYSKQWIPSVYTVSRLTDAMLNVWPVHIAQNIIPSQGITLVSFSNQTPLPYTDQLTFVRAFDDREQFRVFLTSILHGLLTRLIWIYPSWKQSSANQFYKKTQYYVGLARINLLEHDTDELRADFPMTFTTFCLCSSASESVCSLPLLSSSNLRISRESCSVNGSLIYEEVIDLMAESLLSEDKNKLSTKDSIYLFSRQMFFQSDDFILLSSSSSPSKLLPWLDSPFILHIDLSYFIGSVTSPSVATISSVNITSSSHLATPFIDYLHLNSLSHSNNDGNNTEESLRNNEYFTPNANEYADHSFDDQIIRVSYQYRSSSLIHQYIMLVRNLFHNFSKLQSTERMHLIDTINQLISAMILLISPQNSSTLSYWSNETLISRSSCCSPASVEPLVFNSNKQLSIYNQWKDNFRLAFYEVDNYCSYSSETVSRLLNLPQVTYKFLDFCKSWGSYLNVYSGSNWIATNGIVTGGQLNFSSEFFTHRFRHFPCK
ncbi:unnamed protein product [Heterobilharzia americana]|nr:unnamed protein product [Heterobilharzia americana]